MPTIIITQKDGTDVSVEASIGQSMMQAVVDSKVSGIIGECGGAAMCGTCHVFIKSEHLDILPPLSQNENELLDCTATPRRPNSRLSCQLKMTAALEGIQLELPEQQQY